jgi:hypothetical protein
VLTYVVHKFKFSCAIDAKRTEVLSVEFFLVEIVLGCTEAPVCPRSPKNASSLAWPFVVQDNDGKQVRQSRSHFVFEEGTRNKKVVKKRYSIKKLTEMAGMRPRAIEMQY